MNVLLRLLIQLLVVLTLVMVTADHKAFGEDPTEIAGTVLNTSNTEKGEVKLNRDYLLGYLYNGRDILTAPSRWKKEEWLGASVFAGVTAGLYAYDQDIQDWVREHKNGTSQQFADFGNIFGDGKYTLPPLGLFYLYGNRYGDDRAERTSLLALESFVISGVITAAVKAAAGRHRPYTGSNSETWDGPEVTFSTDYHSFPSGHSQSAFSIATVIASEYEHKRLVPPIAYGIAALTALSRVHDDKHWVSDVFVGSSIGYFTAKAVLRLNDSKSRTNLAIIPVTEGNHNYLSLFYRF